MKNSCPECNIDFKEKGARVVGMSSEDYSVTFLCGSCDKEFKILVTPEQFDNAFINVMTSRGKLGDNNND